MLKGFDSKLLNQHNQSWSASKIGRHIGCNRMFVSRWLRRHQQSGGISDKPRSGRPLKADDTAENYVLTPAQLPKCTSAADIAARTQQAMGLKLSPSTVTRLWRRKGLQHLTAKVVPMPTGKQKQARL